MDVGIDVDTGLGVRARVQVVAMDTRSGFSGTLDPAIAKAEDAIGSQQILCKAESGRIVGHLFEHGVFPEQEAKVVVDVIPAVHIVTKAVVHDLFQRLFQFQVIAVRPDFFWRYNGVTKGFQFGDIGLQPELL